MFDAGPTKLYETLALVLGLEELTDAEKALKTARLERSHLVETVADDLEKLRADLEVVDDERARRCLAAVAGRAWDLDEVADMLAGGPSTAGDLGRIDVLNGLRALAAPEREAVVGVVARLRAADEQLERVAGTDADRARRTARLLDDALALHATHGDGDCPVCGRTGALTAAWREEAEAEVRALRQQAADAEAAERAARDARQDGHALLARVPSILDRGPSAGVDTAPLAAAWTRWAEGCDLEELVPLADHLETSHAVLAAHIADVKEAARAELARREDRWRPVAVRLTVWLVRAREAVAAKAAVADLKVAETWLAEAAGTIRKERFAPIAGEALTNWRLLRHDPNVDVEEVVFAGKGVRRHVQLGVTVDGVGSAALGVMSQGELHALALSLFLPRAMLPESPFRFVVIDDPVQSMDPARVDGLARVLERAAAGRQVVVFTHDDRLPDAVRRLALDPVRRYLEDAMALARTDDLPTDVAMRVVPTFCRLAIESACTEVARRRRLARGVPHGKVEADLVALRTITQRAAVALFDDETCGGKVLGSLNTRFGRWAGDTFMVVKQGAHQGWNGDLPGLVDGTRRLTARVREL